jgi:hypothetical protein
MSDCATATAPSSAIAAAANHLRMSISPFL